MKKIINSGLLIFSVAILFSACSKFEEINIDPSAAGNDNVQPEYFINSSIVGAQMDPDVAERSFVLYWKTAARQHLSGGLSSGSYNDDWSTAYYYQSASWQNAIYSAITLAQEKIDNKTSQPHTNNLLQVARIWRAYLISEMADNFGPTAIVAFQEKNPEFNSVKDVYYFIMAETKDAATKLDLNVTNSNSLKNDKITFSYKYEYAKWQKFANSLRMRFAMRLSEVDPAKAKLEFEDAVKDSKVILHASERFDVIEKEGWDALTGVMSREWNLQYLSAALNNIYTGLGSVKSESQLTESAMKAKIKPENYIGLKFADFYTDKTNDPTVGYWLDGLPNIIDPRAYKTFIIPGWFSNPNYCYYPSWTNDAKTTKRSFVDANGNSIKEIDATYTWNTTTTGDWDVKGSRNQLRSYPGTTPTLSLKFRNSTNKRIFFAEWETYFLIAEAAIRGWTVPMSAKAAYEAGIKSSFEYWDVAEYLNTYLASVSYSRTGTSVSWDHTAEPPATHTMNYIDGMKGTAGTVEIKYPVNNIYKGGAVKNDHLTKIITQKYIAQVPWLPLEAWSDKRRLGLPFFENPAIENLLPNLPALTHANYMTSNIKFFPQRIKYPSGLKNNNLKGYNQAVELLNGEDEVLTPLWWAKKQ